MNSPIAVVVMRVIEVLFFLGLTGCVAVVLISWISVGKDSFSDRGNS